MNWRLYVLTTAGFLAGLFLARWQADSSSPGALERADWNRAPVEREVSGNDPEGGWEVRMEEDSVLIARDQVASLALKSSGCRLRMDDDGFPCVGQLANFVRMSDSESERFRRLLETAASERRGWERANVMVTQKRPREWELFYPGDGGEARMKLRQGIEEILGPERTKQVDLFGEINGFFGMTWIAPSFRHGMIRVRARGGETVDPHRSFRVIPATYLSVGVGDRPAVQHGLDGTSLNEMVVRERLLPLLGGVEAVRKAAETGADGE